VNFIESSHGIVLINPYPFQVDNCFDRDNGYPRLCKSRCTFVSQSRLPRRENIYFINVFVAKLGTAATGKFIIIIIIFFFLGGGDIERERQTERDRDRDIDRDRERLRQGKRKRKRKRKMKRR
jgi:hypothetical protein